jgi:hypothetical protein
MADGNHTMDEARNARVRQLKRHVSVGAYEVDSHRVADAMLQRPLLAALLHVRTSARSPRSGRAARGN